ncbi:PqiC family protein [Neisseria perflava]|uniref:PqiC family protein n=1 Tax=Neisseria perflava TaxID=33053 RepID=UPI0020A05ED0|nr:ABC-type transport auxiliary lipoprotein family protein [Neisseria perflava]MCP1659435.1 putative lipoprotein YmbA [Neisseria perflava]MCP1772275.1 putative lipoprotein YmbA [Neisseria perflava]
MRLFALTAALLLAACGTAQTTQYFVLPDSSYTQPDRQGEEIAVKVILADALDKGGLVYQTDAYHVNFARNHLWANPLDSALAGNLSNKLNRLSRQYVFVPSARSHSRKQLKIYVEAFNGSYQGKTVVSGYALWPDGRSKPFHAETAQQGDGYTAMVESLADGLQQAAQDMVE